MPENYTKTEQHSVAASYENTKYVITWSVDESKLYCNSIVKNGSTQRHTCDVEDALTTQEVADLKVILDKLSANNLAANGWTPEA